MDTLANIGIPLLIAVFGPFLLLLAKKALVLAEKRLGVELSKEERSMFDGMTHRSLAFAEEASRKVKKDTTERTGLSGSEKMDAAVNFILEELHDAGKPPIPRARVERMLESKLATSRFELNTGAGAE